MPASAAGVSLAWVRPLVDPPPEVAAAAEAPAAAEAAATGALRAARAALARCAAFPFGYYAVSIAGSAVFAGAASSALRRAWYAK